MTSMWAVWNLGLMDEGMGGIGVGAVLSMSWKEQRMEPAVTDGSSTKRGNQVGGGGVEELEMFSELSRAIVHEM
jgi:hypothetical protein